VKEALHRVGLAARDSELVHGKPQVGLVGGKGRTDSQDQRLLSAPLGEGILLGSDEKALGGADAEFAGAAFD